LGFSPFLLPINYSIAMRYQASKLSGIIISILFLIPNRGWAQNTNSEFPVSIYRSKVTEGAAASSGFFNTTTLGLEYQHESLKNLNGIAGIRYLQIIAPGDGSINTASEAIKRFSKSFLTFDTGISLIPFLIGDTFQIRFSPGLSLRHRNGVTT